jgi:hypothetical protein
MILYQAVSNKITRLVAKYNIKTIHIPIHILRTARCMLDRWAEPSRSDVRNMRHTWASHRNPPLENID